jgi:hypothetical protein
MKGVTVRVTHDETITRCCDCLVAKRHFVKKGNIYLSTIDWECPRLDDVVIPDPYIRWDKCPLVEGEEIKL